MVKITAIFFATFLFFATVETVFIKPDTSAKAQSDSSVLEVPITGSVSDNKTGETYETLIEIAILALTGTGFYALNAKNGNSP